MNTTYHGPQMAQDAFFLSIPTDAAQYAHASAGTLRRAVEAQIETLIAFLDVIDGDTDREEDGADPSDHAIRHYATGGWTQGEDDEPSIGWAEAESLQDVTSHIGFHGQEDCELDCCDDEDSHDLEAVL